MKCGTKDEDMPKPLQLTESMENYLEIILELEKANKVARAKDIAEKLEIKKGSVTGGLKTLAEKGLINYAPYSFITLTDQGKAQAEEIAYRHRVLKDFLLNILQVDPETAEHTACRMEHAINGKTLERLVCFVEYIHRCPRAGDDWLDSFINYCRSDISSRKNCDLCVEQIQPKFNPE